MAIKPTWRFFWKLMKTNVSSAVSLKLNFIIEVLFMAVNNVLLFVSWAIVFYMFREINGWNVNHFILMTGFFMIGYAVYSFCFRGIGDVLAGIIDRGELDTFILQPKNILLNVAGSRSHPSAMGDLIMGIAFVIWSGFTTWQTAGLVLICALTAFLTFFAIGVFAGSLAFWLKDAEGWCGQVINSLLTISTRPGSIYTGNVRLALTFLIPAGALTFLPVELVSNPKWSTALTLIGVTTAFFMFSVWFFYRGLKRYESGNSFGVRG
ncbi:MAG: ABC-2 family transporter protein [Alphaproteobacteria bacterium]|nr:ABC-2 family transporter protein [Alphaproteobacteria bacterium]